jgi:Domain of unknown function (DUF4232)
MWSTTKTIPRALAALALVGAGALAGVAGPGSAGVAAANPTKPPCTSSGLVVWLSVPPGGGAAGSFYYDLQFTNLSGHTCTLTGYPGVSAVDLKGHQLGLAAGRNAATKARVVSVANGTTATAVLQVSDTGAFPPATCRQTTGAGLRVYPPNQKVSKVVPFPLEACTARRATFLHVEAVKKG